MFQFAAFASWSYVFTSRYPCGWVPSFGHPWISARLPAPHGFSQAATSFFACNRQGIHHIHLVAWSYNSEAFCLQSNKTTCNALLLWIMSVLDELQWIDVLNAITTPEAAYIWREASQLPFKTTSECLYFSKFLKIEMTASFEAPFERALHFTEEAELCQMVAQLF